MSRIMELTSWLSRSPLGWLTLTVCVWLAADRIAAACGRHPLVNPLLISIVAIVAVLKATGTSYAAYLSGAQLLQFLIGPAVVALAVPLFKHWSTVKANAVPILLALPAGCVTALLTSVVMGRTLGLSSGNLLGEVSLVNVFASWCVACREEHPLLMRLASEGVVTIHGLNYKDEPENASRWLNANGDPYTRTGADRDGRVAIDWGVYGVPETFVVGADRRIASSTLGRFRKRRSIGRYFHSLPSCAEKRGLRG